MDHVRVPQAGRTGVGDSRHVLRVDLIWPRMAIARKTAERAVTLQDGVYRPDPASWSERALFKESVEGPFGVRVEISEALNNAQWADAVARLGQAVWSLAGASMADLAGNPVSAMLWRVPMDALGRAASAAAKNPPRPVAAGVLDMDCQEWAARNEKRVSIPMLAPADVHDVTRRRVGGKTQARRTVLIRGGDANGEAALIARVYT